MTIYFGDMEFLKKIKKERKKNPRLCKITIDFRMLRAIGIEKNQALNLIERLLKHNKK